MRGEVARLDQSLSATFYLAPTFGNRRLASAPGGTSGGVLPAQGGLEVAYQPPGIGNRDGRIFQAFGRVLWDVKPGTLRFRQESVQGGVGVRYKPLRSQTGFLSVERLFKIGDESAGNWLLRGMYSWTNGYDLRLERRLWNYTTFYGDLAYFAQRPRRGALYGEARQGVTLNLADRLLVTPHVMADIRHKNPGQEISSYLEGGGGLSTKYVLPGGRYERARTSFEVLVHYRVGRFLRESTATPGYRLFSGWVITTVCQF